MDVQPIATYREATFMGKRTYYLFEDHLKVVVRQLNRPHADVQFDLARMNTNFMRIWVRSNAFMWGLFALFLGALTYFSVISIELENPTRALKWTQGLFAVGLIVSVLTFRKTEYAAFTESPTVVIWDVGKSGPDKEKFEDFVNTVVAQIEKVTQKKKPAGST